MVEPDALRLVVAGALRLHVAQRLGPDAPCADLIAAAHELRMPGDALRRTCGVSLEPDYPGVTSGAHPVRGGERLVLACLARRGDDPVAVVLTTLIRGRPARISVAPPGLGLPPGRPPPEAGPA